MRTILVGMVLVMLAPVLVRAQVACGDTIGKGQSVTLIADIGPCDTDPAIPPPGIGFALKVEGGTLDLGGHTLTCADTDGDGRIPVGIRLDGKESRVTNGTVIGCETGLVTGPGAGGEDTSHRVVHVAVQNSKYAGVTVSSNKNTLIDVRATGSSDIPGSGDGFWILGEENTLMALVAIGNSNFGIRISGKRNKLVGATAIDNARDGFWVDDETAKNTLVALVAVANGDSGIRISSKSNQVTGATATGNSGSGFVLDAYLLPQNPRMKNTLTACESTGNGDAGFRVVSRGNKVSDSTAHNNATYGFVFGAARNRVVGGAAYENDGFDVADCYDNKITDLYYGTISSDCVP